MIIGVDPGKNGAAAYISSNGDLTKVYPFSKQLERCREYVFHASVYISAIYIERVSASPNMGVVSAFTFGRYAEAVESAARAHSQIKTVKVRPQTWQEALGCFAKGKKSVLYQKAKELFPEAHKNKVFNRSSADAVLIAYYGWKCEGV